MSHLDNFDLNEELPVSPHEPPLPEYEDRERRRRILIVVAILVALIAIIGGWMWSRRTGGGPDVPGVAEQVADPAGEVSLESAERSAAPIDLPALDASDLLVRELAAALSANPEFASWLVNEDLVRRFVVAVDNIAEGETPRVHLGFMAPKSGFGTAESDGKLRTSAASYRRYNSITEAFISLDSEGSLDLYRSFAPLAEEAYRDLGYPQGRFEDVLRRAAEVVLDTPRVSGSVELEAAVRSFHFADPKLEGLDPVQKQLLRFGPENLAKIQAKVQALLRALDGAGT